MGHVQTLGRRRRRRRRRRKRRRSKVAASKLHRSRLPSPRRLRGMRLVLFVRSHQSTATVSERHSLRPWSSFVTVYYDLVVVLCIFICMRRVVLYMYPNVVVSKISALSKFLFHVAKTRHFFDRLNVKSQLLCLPRRRRRRPPHFSPLFASRGRLLLLPRRLALGRRLCACMRAPCAPA